MSDEARKSERNPWSFRGMVLGAWRSILMLFVAESTLDKSEVTKLEERWASDDARRGGPERKS
ncbi:hypothetical protein [Naasia lichenicola]|uniref:Uncharacterized protein n=1 Tax=Naasia lichenicola TaxID=2565933 RepID=A0A4S4FJI6_9MICO|nr:hypothetical protein [Naasia lichenicola]THG30074.1 hypothetical protein E6C64_15675 [Naasia lichenicola]